MKDYPIKRSGSKWTNKVKDQNWQPYSPVVHLFTFMYTFFPKFCKMSSSISWKQYESWLSPECVQSPWMVAVMVVTQLAQCGVTKMMENLTKQRCWTLANFISINTKIWDKDKFYRNWRQKKLNLLPHTEHLLLSDWGSLRRIGLVNYVIKWYPKGETWEDIGKQDVDLNSYYCNSVFILYLLPSLWLNFTP